MLSRTCFLSWFKNSLWLQQHAVRYYCWCLPDKLWPLSNIFVCHKCSSKFFRDAIKLRRVKTKRRTFGQIHTETEKCIFCSSQQCSKPWLTQIFAKTEWYECFLTFFLIKVFGSSGIFNRDLHQQRIKPARFTSRNPDFSALPHCCVRAFDLSLGKNRSFPTQNESARINEHLELR